MGCCCCRDDAASDLRWSTLITKEASEILACLKAIQRKIQDITVKSLENQNVDTWKKRGYSDYIESINEVKNRRKQEARPPVFVNMLKPHYEAAAKEAQSYCSSLSNSLKSPDPDWWTVVCILSTHSPTFHEIQFELQQLRTRFELHQVSSRDIQEAVSMFVCEKPLKSAEIDKECQVILHEMIEEVKEVEPLARSCAQLLRLFYVEPEKTEVEVAEQEEKAAKDLEETAKKATLEDTLTNGVPVSMMEVNGKMQRI